MPEPGAAARMLCPIPCRLPRRLRDLARFPAALCRLQVRAAHQVGPCELLSVPGAAEPAGHNARAGQGADLPTRQNGTGARPKARGSPHAAPAVRNLVRFPGRPINGDCSSTERPGEGREGGQGRDTAAVLCPLSPSTRGGDTGMAVGGRSPSVRNGPPMGDDGLVTRTGHNGVF